MLEPADLERGHRLAAAFLVASGETDAALVATHHERGGEPERATGSWLRAAELALVGNDFDAALACAARGAKNAGKGEMLGLFRLVSAEASRWKGDASAGLSLAKEAASLLPRGSASYFRAVGEVFSSAGRLGAWDDVEFFLDEALSIEAAKEARSAQIALVCPAATFLLQAGRTERAAAVTKRVQALARVAKDLDPHAMGRLQQLKAFLALGDGDLAGARRGYVSSMALFESAGYVRQACVDRINLGFVCAELGDFERAEEVLTTCLSASQRMRLGNVEAACHLNLARVFSEQGHVAEADLSAQRAEQLGRAQSSVRLVGTAEVYRSVIAYRRGAFVALRGARAQGRADARERAADGRGRDGVPRARSRENGPFARGALGGAAGDRHSGERQPRDARQPRAPGLCRGPLGGRRKGRGAGGDRPREGAHLEERRSHWRSRIAAELPRARRDERAHDWARGGVGSFENVRKTMIRSSSLVAVLVGLVACAPRPVIELRPKGGEQPIPAPRRSPPRPCSRRRRPRGREVVVSAKNPRTSIGHVNAGERVHISVVEASWTNDPGSPLVGVDGAKELCSSFGSHQCIGGHHVAPMMGLVLLTESRRAAPGAEPSCAVGERIHAPTGLEMEVPDEVDLFLGPNDQEGALSDNVGALSVEVEVSASKSARTPISKEVVEVSSQAARTLAAHVLRGQYVRVTPKKGKWIHDPKLSPVDAEGFKAARCVDGAGRCLAPSGAAPLDGAHGAGRPLRRRGAADPAPNVKREFIAWGKDFVATEEGELFLAPNDWEDGLSDNSGAARVVVEIGGR